MQTHLAFDLPTTAPDWLTAPNPTAVRDALGCRVEVAGQRVSVPCDKGVTALLRTRKPVSKRSTFAQ